MNAHMHPGRRALIGRALPPGFGLIAGAIGSLLWWCCVIAIARAVS
ncbi:MAG TPA: hypothetical protein VF404_06875 [Sphingomonas sp.]